MDVKPENLSAHLAKTRKKIAMGILPSKQSAVPMHYSSAAALTSKAVVLGPGELVALQPHLPVAETVFDTLKDLDVDVALSSLTLFELDSKSPSHADILQNSWAGGKFLADDVESLSEDTQTALNNVTELSNNWRICVVVSRLLHPDTVAEVNLCADVFSVVNDLSVITDEDAA